MVPYSECSYITSTCFQRISNHLGLSSYIHLYMYTYIYMHIYVDICIYTCACAYLHLCLFLCLLIFVYISIYTSIYLSIYTSTYVSLDFSLSLYIYISIRIYLHLFVYIYIYLYQHPLIYIYLYLSPIIHSCFLPYFSVYLSVLVRLHAKLLEPTLEHERPRYLKSESTAGSADCKLPSLSAPQFPICLRCGFELHCLSHKTGMSGCFYELGVLFMGVLIIRALLFGARSKFGPLSSHPQKPHARPPARCCTAFGPPASSSQCCWLCPEMP